MTSRAAVAVLLGVAVFLAGVPVMASGAVVNASIESVNVTPEAPMVGEQISVVPTVRNLQSSNEDMTIDSIVLRSRTGHLQEFDRINDVGTLSPGTTLNVPLAVSFDATGTKQLSVVVYASSPSEGRFLLTYPVTITVRDQHPRVTVDVTRPAAGVETTATVTVANGLSRTLNNVEVSLSGIETDQPRRVASTLPAGDTETFTFQVTPTDVGDKQVTARVSYALSTGLTRTATTQTSITVNPQRAPGISLDFQRPIVGVQSNATVTISNGLSRDLRSVEVRLDGVPTEQTHVVRSRIPAGETTTVSFDAIPQAAGSTDVTVVLSYSLGNGSEHTVTSTATVDVEPLRDRVSLDATAASGSIEVTVSNLGNAPVEGIIVQATAGSTRVGQTVIDSLAPRSSTTVSLAISGFDRVTADEVRISAAYQLRGRPGYIGEAEGDVITAASALSANITVTGLTVAREPGGTLRVTGSASNVGLTEANSVIVRVLPAPGVTPAEPNREFFVGTVPSSDFVSFDVYARVTGNVSAIPLEVTYLAGGERRRSRVSVPIESAMVQTPDASGGGGGWLLPAVGGLVVIGGVSAIVYIGWRRRSGGP